VSYVEIDCDGKYVVKESGRFIPPKLVVGKKYWMLKNEAYSDLSVNKVIKTVYVGTMENSEIFLNESNLSEALVLTDMQIKNFRVTEAYKRVTYVLCACISKVKFAVLEKQQIHCAGVTWDTVLQWYPSGNIPEEWTPLESNEKTRSIVEVDT